MLAPVVVDGGAYGRPSGHWRRLQFRCPDSVGHVMRRGAPSDFGRPDGRTIAG